MDLRSTADCGRSAIPTYGRSMGLGCYTTTRPIRIRCIICAAAAGQKRLQAQLDRALNDSLRARKDDFLPAAEYIKRAGVGHYKEVTMPAGHKTSPWGDWRSTLT